MGNALGETPLFDGRVGYASEVDTWVKAVIGASGVISSSVLPGDPAWAISRTGVGTYALTFPVCADLVVSIGLFSPVLTVTSAICTAYSATSGTATIQCSVGTTPTEAASGDELHIFLSMKPWANL